MSSEIRTKLKSLRNIHQALFPAPQLLLGMGLAQIVATLQVYVSNLRLFGEMTAVAAAGFLPVPNQEVMPRLLEVETAFWGGLLFTLSIGAGLSLVSIGAAWIWQRRPFHPRLSAAALASLPVVALVLMNSRGVDLWVSLYFIVIPPPVFWTTWRALGRPGRVPDREIFAWRFLPLIFLTLAWFIQYDRGLFIDLRDHLLMSNTVGEGVSRFYYRYTLYPAEVFKSLDQRLIKTVAWPYAGAGGRHAELARELIRLDYLPVGFDSEADLGVELDGDRLVFTQAKAAVLETTTELFFADPRRVMAEVANRTDRWFAFRFVAFYGVLLAFPVTLYFLLLAILRLLAGSVAEGYRAEALSAAVCLLIGLGILAYFHYSREAPPRAGDIPSALNSERWQKRVAALKEMRERGLDICKYSGFDERLRSSHPQERYWLARALAVSPNPAAAAALARLLDDPHIQVRTMALEGLAQRLDRAAVPRILKRLKASNYWYDQLYAYKALRTLGWRQARSH